ncbi:TPA: ribosome biogenesis GTPase Der [Legionella pneumophila subsp. pneumophila]|uniref:GTPase Der n=1 Tax=Legionella pneumophila (strain Lens) TaxID=297245 RepID=DER_LEGPL|nr:ribosome biogenesis GTPase Der [Legionella pneumophila]Q5WWG8.1 RecName: Full=GTPase Der; AltName: Full=GTP-binding protein EngA [Legionella pneumophila str. Lens]AOW51930.1 ribosome biogenesis GTPase Der [Legionella pneumophila subsp. pneumophila]AOW54477.1 ribosome biogenesis GTPase Der [Legionella pneumophila subsp. pneumophila]AOW57228.1 ribosome biogenesis GTPase Der [Legionella pneumophila subsp. pneumophila]AOW59845.1 ribosome biogenesis GTPase Der [Legionella pneumophila subsp. pneu
MIPVIALVGRPNVGKSTLFNRITKTQDALVADFPGLTRDRQYGHAQHENKSFIIVDTGGIGVDDIEVDTLMSKQSQVALNEANVILFLVDGRSGLTGIDQQIAQALRKLNKKVHLVVNKTDGINEDIACADFQSLGITDIHAISASHGGGISSLLEEILEPFITEMHEATDDKAIKIAFAGRPNVGKSTLINRILGEERVVVYDMPGTTRDSISIPFTREDKQYVLIDTAGVRRKSRIDEKIEKFSVIKTLQAIKEAHVCLLLLDANEGITDQDMNLLGFIIESGKALVIAVNKWDGLEEEHKEKIKSELSRRLHFANFAKIRFISALHGSGVGGLFKDINEAYHSAIQSFSTPKLTRLLQDISAKHTPPCINGRRIKLRYAHLGGHNPPVIVIHGNQLDALPESYKRYLNNEFIKHLGLVGTPLKIEFKGGQNPFANKKNKLSQRQVNKKKRLMRWAKNKK